MTRFLTNPPSSNALGPIGKRGGGFKPFKPTKPTNNPGGKKRSSGSAAVFAYTAGDFDTNTRQTFDVQMPTTSAGALLVAIVTYNSTLAATPTATDWTVVSNVNSYNALNLLVLKKTAAGSDTLSVDLGVPKTIGGTIVYNIPGANTVTIGTKSEGGVQTIDPPSVTFSGTGNYSFVAAVRGGAVTTPVAPTGYTLSANNGNGSLNLQSFYKASPTSAEDPAAYDTGGGQLYQVNTIVASVV